MSLRLFSLLSPLPAAPEVSLAASLQSLSVFPPPHQPPPLPHPDAGWQQNPHLWQADPFLSAHCALPPPATRRPPPTSQLCHFGAVPVPEPLQHYAVQARPALGLTFPQSLSQSRFSPPRPHPALGPSLWPPLHLSSLSHQKTCPNTPEPHLRSPPPLPGSPSSLLPPLVPRPRPGPSRPLGPSLPPAPPLWTGWAELKNKPHSHGRTRAEGRELGGPAQKPRAPELAGAGPRGKEEGAGPWLPSPLGGGQWCKRSFYDSGRS